MLPYSVHQVVALFPAGDLLPEALLKQLASQKNPALRIPSAQEQQAAKKTAQAAAAKAAKRRKLEAVRKGPVTVAVLKHTTGNKNSEAALSFLKEQLHGGRTKRSMAMLAPRNGSHLAPAAKFV